MTEGLWRRVCRNDSLGNNVPRIVGGYAADLSCAPCKTQAARYPLENGLPRALLPVHPSSGRDPTEAGRGAAAALDHVGPDRRRHRRRSRAVFPLRPAAPAAFLLTSFRFTTA